MLHLMCQNINGVTIDYILKKENQGKIKFCILRFCPTFSMLKYLNVKRKKGGKSANNVYVAISFGSS